MAAQCGVKGRNSKPVLLLLKSRARRRLIVHMAAVILMMLAQTVVMQTLRERVRADKWCARERVRYIDWRHVEVGAGRGSSGNEECRQPACIYTYLRRGVHRGDEAPWGSPAAKIKRMNSGGGEGGSCRAVSRLKRDLCSL